MGIGDRYTEFQPTLMPNIDKKLIDTRLDICEKYDLDEGGLKLRWSQEKVIKTPYGSNII